MALKKVQNFSVPVKLDNLSATGTTNSNHQARPNSVGAKVKNQSKGLLHDYLRTMACYLSMVQRAIG